MIVTPTTGAIIGLIAVGACYGIAWVVAYADAESFDYLSDDTPEGDWPQLPVFYAQHDQGDTP